MRKKNRSFLLMSLISVSLLVSVFTIVQAQSPAAAAAKATKWSDSATWPNLRVPVAGDKVTIDAGKEVVLDVNTPALGGVTVDGKLSFANTADVELTTEWIMLHGELEIGTEKVPHTRKAAITFTNNVKDEDISGVGGTTDKVDRGIMLMGGTLNLHGNQTNTWTKLSNTAAAGATSIQVLNAAGWKVGDEIVLASTDFDPRQAERRTIAAIRGIRSRSTRSWTTCTSARSPSTWMNAAKSVCSRAISRSRHRPTRNSLSTAGTSWRWSEARCSSRASNSIAWART